MRISDWSSDVCSSDLPEGAAGRFALIEDLLLLEHLREHDVPGHHGHEDEDEEGGPCNRAALLKGRHQAIGIRITGVFHSDYLSNHKIRKPAARFLRDRKSTRLNSSH